MATESQIFANQQNDQKSAKWQGQHNKMRQIIGGKLTLIMQNKANRRPLAGNPKHEILNPKQYRITKISMTKTVYRFEFRYLDLFGI